MYLYNTTSANKKWKIVKNGTAISFINIATGKALDIANGGSSSAYKNGTTIGTYAINTTNAQKFILEKTVDAGIAVTNLNGWYRIQPAGSPDYSLDINGASCENKANAQIWENNDTSAQKFYFEKIGSDKYVIRTGTSGGLSALDAWGTNNNVYQWVHGKDNSQNQRIWKVIKNTDGTFSFLNVATHKYLDLLNGTLSESNNVRVWNGNDTIAEKWTITPTDAPETYTKNGWKDSRYFENGIPVTGWKQVSGLWYWFNQYGIKQTGWKLFTSAEGEKTKHYSYFGNDGKLVKGWFTADSGYKKLRYADSNGWVYGALWRTNKPVKANVGVSGSVNADYYFNNTGELVQVKYNNYKHLNQRAFYATESINYGNGCGSVSSLMAANMIGKLHYYIGEYFTNNNRYVASTKFREYMNAYIKNTSLPLIGRTNEAGTFSCDNAKALSTLGIKATYVEDNDYYTSKLREQLTLGKVAVPLVYVPVRNAGNKILHFVTINGWKIENGKLYYNVVDPYRVEKKQS